MEMNESKLIGVKCFMYVGWMRSYVSMHNSTSKGLRGKIFSKIGCKIVH